ncbi:MAG TPA: 4-alpha-glucanotransferase [Steroidobacteraceae bacterium]
MPDSLIDQLASQRGIGDAYRNYRGDPMTISRATKKALLAAMGCPVDDEAAMRQALHEHEARRWSSVLPPVAVVRPGHFSLTVGVPVDALEREFSWRIEFEDGGERAGHIRCGELGEAERAEIDGRWQTRRHLWIPDDLPHGYHTLHVTIAGTASESCALIVAPRTCFEPQALREGRRLWGVAVQLYTLRSRHNWGIGDFADLQDVVRGCAPVGAAFIGLNPLHALFPGNPWHFSPYSASSRHFLNVLYIAVEQLPEFAECNAARHRVATAEFQAELQRLRATANVDYPGVARAKLPVLETLFEHFEREHVGKGSRRAQQFQAFKAERGETLRLHALHDAIDEHLRARDRDRYWGWPVWPEELRDPHGPGVHAFEVAHGSRVQYYAWLQWIADEQLRSAQHLARALGMPIGLYGDYAVGVNPSGAETWSDQLLYRKSAGVGAPPDALALKGQDWGIPPQDPNVLQAEHYQPLRDLLSASMRVFGALRLDHVMALYRQWWVPVGLESTEGGYVHYPVDDLMSVLALESERHSCLVVGEDLGTVPAEMSQMMAERHVYSYRVLLFEKHGDGRFRHPGEYPRRAIATVTTHDLPTLKGYWTASDIELRQRLALYPSDEVRQHVLAERIHDREALLLALGEQGLRPAHREGVEPPYSDELAHGVQVYLARSASALVVLQAEDLAGMPDPVNVPGTSDEHANWQRKMSADLADVFAREPVGRLFADVRGARKS